MGCLLVWVLAAAHKKTRTHSAVAYYIKIRSCVQSIHRVGIVLFNYCWRVPRPAPKFIFKWNSPTFGILDLFSRENNWSGRCVCVWEKTELRVYVRVAVACITFYDLLANRWLFSVIADSVLWPLDVSGSSFIICEDRDGSVVVSVMVLVKRKRAIATR